MIATLIEPFAYSYMVNAMWVSALVARSRVSFGLSHAEGWSLIGDALSHSIVPGVAGPTCSASLLAGRLLSGALAAGAMLFLNQRTRLKEDTIIGLIFTSFFGRRPVMVSCRRPR